MSGEALSRRLPLLWYRRRLAPALIPLLPVSWLFGGVVALRRALYRAGLFSSEALPAPVIVVGNISVGGSGKTPLVLMLAKALRATGRRPGIVSRGYGGASHGVREVSAASSTEEVGDEPLLLAQRSGCPVFVGRDRVAAGRALLAAHPECDVLLADDGLQHYRLRRDIEIAVIDKRGAGNGRLLPAGPLREPWHRLASVDAVVENLGDNAQDLLDEAGPPHFFMRLAGRRFYRLGDPGQSCAAEDLHGRRLYAVAGIGDPSRFFSQLGSLGLEFTPHPFPDHHRYTAADLDFARDGTLLMTEKDAVKCPSMALSEAWVLPVEAQIDAPPGRPGLIATLLEKLDGRPPA